MPDLHPLDDLPSAVSWELGLPIDATTAAMGALLNAIAERASPSDFRSLIDRLPGAALWMNEARRVAASGRTTPASELGSLIAVLSRVGIDAATAGRLVPLALSRIRTAAGPALFARLASGVPLVAQAAPKTSGKPPR